MLLNGDSMFLNIDVEGKPALNIYCYQACVDIAKYEYYSQETSTKMAVYT